MIRSVFGVVAGYIFWTALWLAGNLGIAALYPDETEAFNEGGNFDATAPLAIALVLSVICSIAAGMSTRSIARNAGAVKVLALLLLLTGIGVQSSVWNQMPLMYHIVFLALLVPVCIAGGKLKQA